jgi:hypothetical protein
MTNQAGCEINRWPQIIAKGYKFEVKQKKDFEFLCGLK